MGRGSMSGSFAPPGICYWPLAVAAVAYAGASAYSASAESSAAKKAAAAQERVGMAQIAATKEAPILAAEEAKAKLKLKQATKSNTILTSPLGDMTDANTNTKSILGV